MLTPDPHWGIGDVLRAAYYGIFAVLCGTLGCVLRLMDAGSNVSTTRVLVEGISAGVVGVLIMWICEAMAVSQPWTAVSVGVGGWMGASASIQVIQRAVWGRLGLNGDNGNESAK